MVSMVVRPSIRYVTRVWVRTGVSPSAHQSFTCCSFAADIHFLHFYNKLISSPSCLPILGYYGVLPVHGRNWNYSVATFAGWAVAAGPIQTVWILTNSRMPNDESSRP